MLLWMSLLVLAPVSEFAATPQSVISLHPQWTTVFQGESVKLTCSGFRSSAPRETVWYLWDYKQKKETEIKQNPITVRDSGEYRCQVPGSLPSMPVTLLFSSDDLILQTPHSVFEADSMVLRCRGKREAAVKNMKLHRNKSILKVLSKNAESYIKEASLKDSGTYYCTGDKEDSHPVISKPVEVQVQELFADPVLMISPSKSIEGSLVTLTCNTSLPPQKSNVQLWFHLFSDAQNLRPMRQNSPEFKITSVWRKDPGAYWCEARTTSLRKISPKSYMYVQRIVANIQILTNPELGLVFEGQELVLICSVDGIPEPFQVVWYRKDMLRKTMMVSKLKELKISKVKMSDAGEYYCKASKGHLSFDSKPVDITVKVPVSPPVLTWETSRARILEGETVMLLCKTKRGSGPILYQLFHEDVLIQKKEDVFTKKKIVTSREISSVYFSLRAEQSGNYYCTANNGLGDQRSNSVPLSVTVPVSPPVLTLHTPRGRALEGDIVTLSCKAQRGSHLILYTFYHMDVHLAQRSIPSGSEALFSFPLTKAHSGIYYCTASNGYDPQHSEVVNISIPVPVPRPVLTLRTPQAQTIVGDLVEFHCEAQGGSPPILYQFYHEDVSLGSSSAPLGGGVSFNLSLTTEHSGKYYCEADNGLGAQHSDRVSLSVKVPVSHPVLTFRIPRAQAVEGDMMELHCEVQSGSPPILYQFYHEHVSLGSNSAPAGGGVSFNISLKAEHSGNFFCEADNGLEVQRSEIVTISVIVPVSLPVLTLRTPRAQIVVGDVIELHCEVRRGSLPIKYLFYHEDIILENSLVTSEGGASFNLSLTAEHSGNYSCQASNDVEDQLSEVVEIYITGLTESRSGAVNAGLMGALLSMMALAVGTFLFYHWLRRNAVTLLPDGEACKGGRPTCATTRIPGKHQCLSHRNHSELNPQEPTYSNVPDCLELQPVYSNVNLSGENVIYTEVKKIKVETNPTVASEPGSLKNEASSVIYSEVKVTSTPASRTQPLVFQICTYEST